MISRWKQVGRPVVRTEKGKSGSSPNPSIGRRFQWEDGTVKWPLTDTITLKGAGGSMVDLADRTPRLSRNYILTAKFHEGF